ncbi:hypothetical protein F4809DRAFT_643013 [Biscogniauxia mediterranea]|nr:hypothetical protein F4809DRAFT_643013 [Biscogniauxia mediterranea]
MEDPPPDHPDETSESIDEAPDVEIEKRTINLQDAVQSWINELKYNARKNTQRFGRSFGRVLDNGNPQSYLHSLGYGIKPIHTIDIEWLQWMGASRKCSDFILGRHIWVYLYEHIFRRSYPIGVSGGLARTFNDILSSMEMDGDDDDTDLRADKWNFETINSLRHRASTRGDTGEYPPCTRERLFVHVDATRFHLPYGEPCSNNEGIWTREIVQGSLVRLGGGKPTLKGKAEAVVFLAP